MGLTDAELTAMREAINDLMPDTCSILTITGTSDGAGGYTYAASGTATASCRLDLKTGTEKDASGALVPFSSWILSLPYDTTITEQNQVVHGGYTYNVINVNTDASWIGVKRARLERVP